MWAQLIATVALLLLASGASAEVRAPGGSVDETALTFPTHDGLELEARLTRRHRSAPSVGIVLIHGSGPTDLNETIPAHLTSTGRTAYPFQELAMRLAQQGFAVLRYNKRGVQLDPAANDPAVLASTSLTDLVKDARAAVHALRGLSRDPPERVVLLGHSEGSVIASLAAEQEGGIAGIACVAPLAHSLELALHFQLVERVAAWAQEMVDTDHDGQFSEAEVQAHPRYRMNLTLLDRDGDGAISYEELNAGLEADWRAFVREQVPVSPWLKEHFLVEPNLTRFPRLGLPVQIFHGELDAQAPVSEGLELAEAIRLRGHAPVLIKTFPGLGHGLSPPLAPDRPTVGPIATEALETIASSLARVYLHAEGAFPPTQAGLQPDAVHHDQNESETPAPR